MVVHLGVAWSICWLDCFFQTAWWPDRKLEADIEYYSQDRKKLQVNSSTLPFPAQKYRQ